MIFTLFAVFSRIGFTFISVYWKHFRDKGLSTRAVLGFAGPLSLMWVPLAALFIFADILILTPVYLGLVALCVAVILGVRFFSIYLFRYQGLLVSDTLRIFFSAIAAFIVDAFFFHTTLTPGFLGSVFILICGAVLLQTRRAAQPRKEHLAWGPLLFLNAAVAVLAVLEFAFYKAALEHQG